VRTAAILPVKSFARAKQRLGASVADQLRLELARAMVSDVMLALSQTAEIELTIVVTREPSVAEKALTLGAIAVDDESEQGQSAAALLGVRRALAEGIQRVLCVPGDCPALDPAELSALLAPQPRQGPSVVIVPDRHGTGTNGLLLDPPDTIEPSFGPDSCERHHSMAAERGVPCSIERLPSLLLDIDTGADLAVLRERLSDHAGRAAQTRSVLDSSQLAGALTGTTQG
jgi:2-phospho-L-lactate/phosphoenolpyruvate guanylyltransferase